MTCPQCGINHHEPLEAEEAPAAEALAEAVAEVDAGETERAALYEEAATERNADDNDTREAIAECEADAAVEIAQIQADAAVAIAEADAQALAALVAAPEEEPVAEETEPEVIEETEPVVAEEEATPVSVPPQLEDAPGEKPAATGRSVSRFRSHRR